MAPDYCLRPHLTKERLHSLIQRLLLPTSGCPPKPRPGSAPGSGWGLHPPDPLGAQGPCLFVWAQALGSQAEDEKS